MSSPTPSSHLNLRLLSSCTVKLASDPVLTSRFREAILAGFNDTSSGSASSEPFRQLADHFPDFCDRIGLTNLQKLILSFEMVKVLVPPQQSADTPAAQQSPALRNAVALHAKSKDFGLAAVRVLRDSWETGLEELAARRFPDVLGPVGLSRLISATISDLVVDVNNGEIIVADAPEADMLLNTEQKRQLIRALRARVGTELAPQIVNHALDPHAHEPAQ